MSKALGLARSDRQRLKTFKDIHQGRRGFIIGNGPSLIAQDLDRLEGEITFAANKIYLLFSETQFRPVYYAAVDLIFVENFHLKISQIGGAKFFPLAATQWVQPSETLFLFQEVGTPNGTRFIPRFSKDIPQGIYGGFTVSFTLIQLAFYMGIRELYLIGMDHDYNLPGQRAQHHAYGEVLVSDGEVNHFHPYYRPRGEIWSVPKPEYQEQAYRLAGEVFAAHGGQIINLTRGGKLDLFPRLSLEEIFA